MRLYHGSINENILSLKAISKCNDNKDLLVVYLTQNPAYSLFYIWDEEKTKRKIKWVTCFIKDGVVYYEEQFSNQLYTFYNGVSGYIYYVDLDDGITKASEPEMWYTENEVTGLQKEKIDNVYDKILEYEKLGKIVIYRYDELSFQDKEKIDDKMSEYILLKNLLKKDCDDAIFMRRHHVDAWKRAEQKNKEKK